jgi:predicted phage tail protein
VGLWWNRAPGAQSYLLEVGSTTGLADLFSGDIGGATTLGASAPPGTYFVRVRGINAFGVGPASNEVQVALTGTNSCATAPPAPAAASALVAGLATEITWPWTPTATSYVVEAGSSTGLSNLYRGNLGPVLSLTTSAPAGRYFVRVRAANACGESAPTADVEVVLSCSGGPIPAPAALTGATNGGMVTLQWTGWLGHTSYRLEVGSTPGASNLLDIDIGAGTIWEASLAGVAPGTYYVRVRAATGCGLTGPSNEVTVVVP